MTFKIPNMVVKCSKTLFISRTLYKNIVIRTRYDISQEHDMTMIRRTDGYFMTSIYSNTFIETGLLTHFSRYK